MFRHPRIVSRNIPPGGFPLENSPRRISPLRRIPPRDFPPWENSSATTVPLLVIPPESSPALVYLRKWLVLSRWLVFRMRRPLTSLVMGENKCLRRLPVLGFRNCVEEMVSVEQLVNVEDVETQDIDVQVSTLTPNGVVRSAKLKNGRMETIYSKNLLCLSQDTHSHAL